MHTRYHIPGSMACAGYSYMYWNIGTHEYSVISASGTVGAREYSVISAPGHASTQSFQLLVLQWLASTQPPQRLVLQVLASTHQSFQLLVLLVLASILSHFSFWYSRYSRVLSHISVWYSRYSRVLKSFQQLVLQVLASTQVISAFVTPGTKSFKMTGTLESLAGYQWLWYWYSDDHIAMLPSIITPALQILVSDVPIREALFAFPLVLVLFCGTGPRSRAKLWLSQAQSYDLHFLHQSKSVTCIKTWRTEMIGQQCRYCSWNRDLRACNKQAASINSIIQRRGNPG